MFYIVNRRNQSLRFNSEYELAEYLYVKSLQKRDFAMAVNDTYVAIDDTGASILILRPYFIMDDFNKIYPFSSFEDAIEKMKKAVSVSRFKSEAEDKFFRKYPVAGTKTSFTKHLRDIHYLHDLKIVLTEPGVRTKRKLQIVGLSNDWIKRKYSRSWKDNKCAKQWQKHRTSKGRYKSFIEPYDLQDEN